MRDETEKSWVEEWIADGMHPILAYGLGFVILLVIVGFFAWVGWQSGVFPIKHPGCPTCL